PDKETNDSELDKEPQGGDEGGTGSPAGKSGGSGRESTGRQGLKKGANKVADKAAMAAGPEAVAALKAAQIINKHKTLKVAVAVFSLGSVAWPIAGFFFFVLIIIIFMGGPSAADPNDPNAPKLTITKSGPTTASLNEELPYQIAISYPGQAVDIVITDKIPVGTDYIDSSPPAKFDPATRIATWNLKDHQASPGAILSTVSTTLSIRLRATANDLIVVNQAEGTVTPYVAPIGGGGGGPIADGYVPAAPYSNNCNGKWDFSQWPDQNPLGNYGDPQCNFSQDNLRKLIEATEPNPEFWDIWYYMIVPQESVNYRPNAHAPGSDPVQCSLDCGGAWGLYQMGSSTPPGQPPPAKGKNGEFDRGDVNWEIQTKMAIRYNIDVIGCSFRYWQSAISKWGVYSC
ncbi:MAG TPA: hypothetical protein VNA13_00960, partial [Xanthomonadales bacterium]|nr:hypothetical protein [Xanthomonadales bacterium]